MNLSSQRAWPINFPGGPGARAWVALACLVATARANPAEPESECRQLLAAALENQFRGHIHGQVDFIVNSLRSGRDSLGGSLEFEDQVGERKLFLSGPGGGGAYESRSFGREQWLTDSASGRIRRIANRQWRKSAFGSPLTFEDLLKFPTDYFYDYGGCQDFSSGDSAYTFTIRLKPAFQTFYGKLQVALGKSPVLVKSLVFYDQFQRREKSLEVTGYQRVEGKWFIRSLRAFSADSLDQAQVNVREVAFLPSNKALAGRDARSLAPEARAEQAPAGAVEGSEPASEGDGAETPPGD